MFIKFIQLKLMNDVNQITVNDIKSETKPQINCVINLTDFISATSQNKKLHQIRAVSVRIPSDG